MGLFSGGRIVWGGPILVRAYDWCKGVLRFKMGIVRIYAHNYIIYCTYACEFTFTGTYFRKDFLVVIRLLPFKQEYTKVLISTVDTDVLVLAVTAAQRINIRELWVAFGVPRA